MGADVMRCLVAGTQPWTAEVFRRIQREIQAEWCFVQTRAELKENISPPTRWIFILHWHWKVPEDIWANIETVNMHAAPLPLFRGGNPIEHQILAGHTDTTLTAHRVTAEIDAGPIYMQRHGISLAGSKAEILARFVEPVAEMMREIVAYEPAPVPQHGEVVRFQRLSQDEYDLVWKERV